MRKNSEDVGFIDGNWGRAGSGMLFTTGEKILLLKRSRQVLEPGTWGIPGGAIPEWNGKMKNPKQSALDEVREELGFVPSFKIVDKYVYKKNSFVFYTYIAISSEFTPKLNWESDDFQWFFQDDIFSLNLHPGVKQLLLFKDPFNL
jgi:8-oxo-dGTP pyrophosphatase MutT (NUDIX family)